MSIADSKRAKVGVGVLAWAVWGFWSEPPLIVLVLALAFGSFLFAWPLAEWIQEIWFGGSDRFGSISAACFIAIAATSFIYGTWAAPNRLSPSPSLKLLDLFEADTQGENKSPTVSYKFRIQAEGTVTIRVALRRDLRGNAEYLTVFVPPLHHTFEAGLGIASWHNQILAAVRQRSPSPAGIVYLKIVYVYHDGELSVDERRKLANAFQSRNLGLELRGSEYLRRAIQIRDAKAKR